ncbi:MAG: glycosyltransferase family 4 protein [Planctomycetes bacterium]|nr:glycosyltransferase family 4 protein [Planctomycetota bacterium]
MQNSVLFVNDATAYGGAELYQTDLAEACLSRGWQAGVVFPDRQSLDGWHRHLQSKNIAAVRYAEGDIRTGRLNRESELLHPTLVHANSSWRRGFHQIMASVAEPSVPRVITEHAYAAFLPRRCSLVGRLQSRMHIRLWREKRRQWAQCKQIITVNERDRLVLVQNWAAPCGRIRCIYHGVDITSFTDEAEARANLHRAMGTKPAEPVIVAVGRIEPGKGFDLLLEALAGLTDRPWRLAMIGDGPCLASLQVQAQKLGLVGRVSFLGYRGDVPLLLGGGDLFVLPSRNEALGYSLLEAMACGLPTVATDSGGPGEILGDSQFGLLVPANGAAYLRDAIGTLLDDPVHRRRLGEKGRQRVVSAFSKQRMIDDSMKVYDDTMSVGAKHVLAPMWRNSTLKAHVR